MTNPKPTLLFVPGSFAPPTLYDGIVALLRREGFPCFALQLPSTVKRMPLPPATMQDDAKAIKEAVEMLGKLGRKEIIVLCHSYGGTPTTEGLAGLTNVKRLVYISAVVPKVGETNIQSVGMLEENLPPETEGYMHVDAVQMAPGVLNDMPFEEAYPLALQLAHHSAISFRGEVTKVAYETIPVSYIMCEKDMIVPPELQKKYIGIIEEGGRKVDVRSIESGHCPNWSVPEKLVETIIDIGNMQ